MSRNANGSVQSARRLPASQFGDSVRGSISDDLPRLADLAKRIYTIERPMQESGLTERPSSYTAASSLDGCATNLEVALWQSVWMKIAGFPADERIGPIDYIARQFDQCRSLAKPLYPNELLGVAAWYLSMVPIEWKDGKPLPAWHKLTVPTRPEKRQRLGGPHLAGPRWCHQSVEPVKLHCTPDCSSEPLSASNLQPPSQFFREPIPVRRRRRHDLDVWPGLHLADQATTLGRDRRQHGHSAVQDVGDSNSWPEYDYAMRVLFVSPNTERLNMPTPTLPLGLALVAAATRARPWPSRPSRRAWSYRTTICSCPASTSAPAWRTTSGRFKGKIHEHLGCHSHLP